MQKDVMIEEETLDSLNIAKNSTATYFGSNGWLLEISSKRIVIDPWLKGDLKFALGEWFFKGTLKKEWEIPNNIDLLLITQGQPDHAHIPTLEKFSRKIPVVCSEAAYESIKRLGFDRITKLSPKAKFELTDVSITATSGAPVPNVENGYIIESENISIYIEPHGFLDKTLNDRQIDVLITPFVNIGIRFIGNFIRGKDILPVLISKFKPKKLLASTSGGDQEFSGLLSNLIYVEGNNDWYKAHLLNNEDAIIPEPGKSYYLTGNE